jgi:hypothetical protein
MRRARVRRGRVLGMRVVIIIFAWVISLASAQAYPKFRVLEKNDCGHGLSTAEDRLLTWTKSELEIVDRAAVALMQAFERLGILVDLPEISLAKINSAEVSGLQSRGNVVIFSKGSVEASRQSPEGLIGPMARAIFPILFANNPELQKPLVAMSENAENLDELSRTFELLILSATTRRRPIENYERFLKLKRLLQQ